MQKEINQLKAGSILTYISLGISTIIPMFYTPIMLDILGQSEYGLYSLSNSIISYLSLLTLGLGSSIIRYMMKYKVNGDKVMFERITGLFVTIYFVISFVVCIVGTSLAFSADKFFSKGLNSAEIDKLKILILLMSLSTAISFVSSVFSTVVICYERYVFSKLISLILTIAAPLLNLAVLYVGYASIGMAMVGVVSQFITLLIYVAYSRIKLKIRPRYFDPPKELLKNIFAFTAFVFIGMIADLLYWATDKVLIGAMVGSAAVAIYNIGSTFNAMLQNLAAAISGVFSPRVNTYVFEKRPMSEMSELMIRVGRLQYLVVSLVLSGFIVFGRDFLDYWAGEGYGEAYPVALLTLIPLSVPLIQNIAFTCIKAQKRHKFRSVLYAVLAIVNVVGTYFLIPVMGIVGAALCTCVVFIIGHVFIMNWYYYKKIGFDIPGFWLNILKMSAVPVALSLAYKAFEAAFLDGVVSIWELLVRILVYTCIFCILTWFFTMNNYEKNLISGLVFRFKKEKRN